MKTLVLPPRFSPDINALWKAAVDAGWETHRLHVLSEAHFLRGRDIVLYGDTLFADVVAEATDLGLVEPSLDFLPELPDCFRLRMVTRSTLGAARSSTTRAFVKPIREKVFPAQVYESGACVDASLDDATEVLVAEPVVFGLEVRVFVASRRIETLSAYLRDGEIADGEDGSFPISSIEESEARGVVETLCKDASIALPPALVIDVGFIEGRGWAVVEANAAWASGLCGCDPRAVLEMLPKACISSVDPAVDPRWLRRWA